MTDWPIVSVLLPTYFRSAILNRTIELLETNLHYSGRVQYLIGLAGEDDTPQMLAAKHPNAVIVRPPDRTLGYNLNSLITTAVHDSPIMIQMDDDHWLMKPLDIDDHVQTLMIDPLIKWIRLMGVGSHFYTADLVGKYWQIDWNSRELYIPSNRPHIKHRQFHEFFGLYPLGRKLGETEEGFCHQCRDIAALHSNPLRVAVPLDVMTESGWKHVGDSWQAKGE